jgi:hypothetical protein
MRPFLVLVLALSGCSSGDGTTSWARATGLFSSWRPGDVHCSLGGGRTDTALWVSNPTLDVRLVLPRVAKGERFQREMFLQYGTLGQTSRGLIDMSRGDTIVDPRIKDEAQRAQALGAGASFFFPITARLLRIEPNHLCNVDVLSGFVDSNDCIDVTEDSTLEDAHFWCDVGILTDPSWSE